MTRRCACWLVGNLAFGLVHFVLELGTRNWLDE